jgi:hypothetical protein
MYQASTPAEGKLIAEQVIGSFHKCPIPEVARLGRTLKMWSQHVLAHFETHRISIGGTEAINLIIEKTRRLARQNQAAVATNAVSVSGGVCHARGLAGSIVQLGRDLVKPVLVGEFEIRSALREVLAQLPVGVFVRTPLPGRVGVGEVDRAAAGNGEGAVLGHLGTPVPGQASKQLLWEPRCQRREDGHHRAAVAGVGQMPEHHEAAAAFDQRHYGAGAANAEQQVTLPMTGHGPVRSFSGPVADVKPFGPRPRGTDGTGCRCLGTAHPSALPQRDLAGQFPSQGDA